MLMLPRNVTYTVQTWFGRLLVGAFMSAVFVFITFLLVWPFLFGGAILYIILHFVRRLW